MLSFFYPLFQSDCFGEGLCFTILNPNVFSMIAFVGFFFFLHDSSQKVTQK